MHLDAFEYSNISEAHCYTHPIRLGCDGDLNHLWLLGDLSPFGRLVALKTSSTRSVV